MSKKSNFKSFSKNLENAIWEKSADGVLEIFKKEHPNLTQEQYDSAYNQILEALKNGIEDLEIKV